MINDKFQMKKIIWAVDAFEEKEDLQEKAARVLAVFQDKTYAEIEPVFVLGSTDLSGPADYSADWTREFETNMRIHLEEVLLSSGFPRILSPKILVEPLAATSAAVETLLSYAKRKLADLIIVSSHGRRGLDRLFLGSFAETLLVHSQTPILVIGVGAKTEPHFSRILFPTEFGENSREAFRRAVSAAQQMGATLQIYHAVPMPSRIVMDSGYYPSLYGMEGEMLSLEEFLRIQEEHQTKRAEAWCEWAKSEGVSCGFKIETAGEPIDDLICRETIAADADLVIMESQSGPLKAALLGSTARNVVRAAPCPVLVFPRQSLIEKETEAEDALFERLREKPAVDLGFSNKTNDLSDLDI